LSPLQHLKTLLLLCCPSYGLEQKWSKKWHPSKTNRCMEMRVVRADFCRSSTRLRGRRVRNWCALTTLVVTMNRWRSCMTICLGLSQFVSKMSQTLILFCLFNELWASSKIAREPNKASIKPNNSSKILCYPNKKGTLQQEEQAIRGHCLACI
jgi:hypothetical protein